MGPDPRVGTYCEWCVSRGTRSPAAGSVSEELEEALGGTPPSLRPVGVRSE